MKKIIFILVASLLLIQNSNSEENIRCADVRDNHKEYTKCITKKGKELGKKGLKKLNTDSKLTDWIKDKLGK